MEKIDYEVDDFMNYCDYKNLSKKSMKSYITRNLITHLHQLH